MEYNTKPILVTDNFDNYSNNEINDEGPFDDLYCSIKMFFKNVILGNIEITVVVIIIFSYLYYLYSEKRKKNKGGRRVSRAE